MPNYRCNVVFNHAGIQHIPGELHDSTSELVARYPANFTAEPELADTLSTNVTWAGTFGPVLNGAGTLYRIGVTEDGTLTTTAI